MILPGATLGMLGGGQLGRMFTIAARTMGYDVIVLDPDRDSPAGSIATRHLCAGYEDAAALDALARDCAAISTEFENVPAASMQRLAARVIVRPGANAVEICQSRIREKIFLRDAGFPTVKFAVIESADDLETALAQTDGPAVLKVSRFGYDGKGQVRVANAAEARQAWETMNRMPCILEQLVHFETELSVVLARGEDGATAVFPVAENLHRHGILDITIAPARVTAAIAHEAEAIAKHIAAKLEYVGVLAVEFFAADGVLRVNEIAPRPHNSGHYTLDACVTNQFEQQVRALCGLPLGDPRQLCPAVMANLLGDLWRDGKPPRWNAILEHPGARLHLYGKREARHGRKMGHFTLLAADREVALREARRIQAQLS